MERTKKLELLQTQIGSITARKPDGTFVPFIVLYGGGMLPWINGKMKHLNEKKYREILRNFLEGKNGKEGLEYIVPTETQIAQDLATVLNNDRNGMYVLIDPNEEKRKQEESESTKEEVEDNKPLEEPISENLATEETKNSKEEPASQEELPAKEDVADSNSPTLETDEKVENSYESTMEDTQETENPLDNEGIVDEHKETLQEETKEPISEAAISQDEDKLEAKEEVAEISNEPKEESVLSINESQINNVVNQLIGGENISDNTGEFDFGDASLMNDEEINKQVSDIDNAFQGLKKQEEIANKKAQEEQEVLTKPTEMEQVAEETKEEVSTAPVEPIAQKEREIDNTKAEKVIDNEKVDELINIVKSQDETITALKESLFRLELANKENTREIRKDISYANTKVGEAVKPLAEFKPENVGDNSKPIKALESQVKTMKLVTIICLLITIITAVLVPLCSVINLKDELNLSNNDEVELHAVIHGEDGENDNYVLIGTFTVEDGVVTFNK